MDDKRFIADEVLKKVQIIESIIRNEEIVVDDLNKSFTKVQYDYVTNNKDMLDEVFAMIINNININLKNQNNNILVLNRNIEIDQELERKNINILSDTSSDSVDTDFNISSDGV